MSKTAAFQRVDSLLSRSTGVWRLDLAQLFYLLRFRREEGVGGGGGDNTVMLILRYLMRYLIREGEGESVLLDG